MVASRGWISLTLGGMALLATAVFSFLVVVVTAFFAAARNTGKEGTQIQPFRTVGLGDTNTVSGMNFWSLLNTSVSVSTHRLSSK